MAIIMLVVLLSLSTTGLGIFCTYQRQTVNTCRQLIRRYETDERQRLAALEKHSPVCLCKHGINEHKENGRCLVVVGTYDAWPGWLRAQGDEICSCRRYTGPEPLLQNYHPQEIGHY
jgi:hypothetical protein